MASASGQFVLNSTKPETFMLTPEQQDALPQESKLALEQVDDLKYFLATAPANWQVDQIIRRYLLPTGEYVSCVLWRNLFHITGTDIVRGLTYRFQAFGRPVRNIKKFEEGIFSDLRNLKNGTDASLEEPKSAFLDLLYKNNCIRTQKKQKVFYWFSVPHDRLFLDALERDLKRERMGTESTTAAVAEPALSFVFDATQSLFEQLTKSLQHNAASEVGASLAAQQAQNNIMAAQYGSLGGGSLGMPFGLGHRSSHAGLPLPTAHYYSRAQSIQSSVPIDYRVPSTGWASLASDPGQPSIEGAGSTFRPGHAHSVSAPVTFHNSFATDNTAQAAAEESEAAFRREYSYDETMGFAMPIAELTNEPAELTAPFKDETPISPTHAPAGDEVPCFDDFSFDAPVDPVSMLPSYVQSVPRPSFGMHFNMFEGSPTYKQRRRRQSIPSSVLMQEQAQLQQQQHRRHRADTSTMSTTTSQQEYTDVTDAEILSSVDQNSEVGGDFNYMQPMDGSSSLGMDEFDYGLHRLQQHTLSGPPGSSGGSSASRPVSRDGSEFDALYGLNGSNTQPYPHARQFPCPKPDCGRGFRRLEHLKRHVRTHTHERPFLCPVCFKKFSRSDNLAQHRRTHERGYPGSGASSPAASVVDVLEGGGAGVAMQRAVTMSGALPGYYGNRYMDTSGGGPTSHGLSAEQHQQQFFGNGQMGGMGMYTTAQMQAFQPDHDTAEMIRTLSMPNFGASGASFPEYSPSTYYGRSRHLEEELSAHEQAGEHAYLPVTPRAIPYHASPRSNAKELQARGDEDGEATPRLRDVFHGRLAIES